MKKSSIYIAAVFLFILSAIATKAQTIDPSMLQKLWKGKSLVLKEGKNTLLL